MQYRHKNKSLHSISIFNEFDKPYTITYQKKKYIITNINIDISNQKEKKN